MIYLYKIKWYFHCLFNMHRQMTVIDKQNDGEVFVGCFECKTVNDKHGNELTLSFNRRDNSSH
jgi:hypothetical protein